MWTSWICFYKTSWRRLEDVLRTDVFKTSSGRLQDLVICLEDVWPRRLCWSWTRLLEDALKVSSEDVWVKRIYSSWSRCLEASSEGVFWRQRRKTSSRRLHQDECLLGIFFRKKANVYYKLERKGQNTMASALPVKTKCQDLGS